MDVLGFQFKVDDLDLASGVFRGLGASFHNIDRQLDVCRPGCFKRTLEERNGDPLPMLWSHRTDEPIGRWTEAAEVKEGLAVTGELLLSVARAREVKDLLRSGIVKGLSIGYGVAPGGSRMDGEVRELVDVDLYEVSCCVFPANPRALVTAPPKSTKEWDQFFRSAGFSRRDAEKLTHAASRAMGDPAEEAEISELITWLKSRNRKGI